MELTDRQKFIWSHFFTKKDISMRKFNFDLDKIGIDDDMQAAIDSINKIMQRIEHRYSFKTVIKEMKQIRLAELLNPDTDDLEVLSVIRKCLDQPFPTQEIIKSSLSSRYTRKRWNFHGVDEINSIYEYVADSIAYSNGYHKSAATMQKYGIVGVGGGSAADYIMSIAEQCKPDFDAIRDWLDDRLGKSVVGNDE